MGRTDERAIKQDARNGPRHGPPADVRPDHDDPDHRTGGGQHQDVADRPNVSSVSAGDYPDHFIRAGERLRDRSLSILLDGGETCVAALSIVRRPRRTLPRVTVATTGGDALRPHPAGKGRIEYHVPASGRLLISWKD